MNAKLAYAVGLITTDGSLSKDKRHIIFVSTDLELINDFQDCLGTKYTVSPSPKTLNKTVYRLQIGNVKLYHWLESLGLFPNKSKTINEVNIPNKYFRDFLRGHLDGDGSIISYIDQYNTKIDPKYIYKRLFVYFISASQKHVKWLQEKIIRLYKLHGSVNGFKNMWRVKFSTKEAQKLLKIIYYKSNLLCLERKHIIFSDFIKNEDNS